MNFKPKKTRSFLQYNCVHTTDLIVWITDTTLRRTFFVIISHFCALKQKFTYSPVLHIVWNELFTEHEIGLNFNTFVGTIRTKLKFLRRLCLFLLFYIPQVPHWTQCLPLEVVVTNVWKNPHGLRTSRISQREKLTCPRSAHVLRLIMTIKHLLPNATAGAAEHQQRQHHSQYRYYQLQTEHANGTVAEAFKGNCGTSFACYDVNVKLMITTMPNICLHCNHRESWFGFLPI